MTAFIFPLIPYHALSHEEQLPRQEPPEATLETWSLGERLIVTVLIVIPVVVLLFCRLMRSIR